MKNQTLEIPVEHIMVIRNDRQVFDLESLNELTFSIAEHGILQNLIVRPAKDKKDQYELVAGERRLKAGIKAELKTVPCTVKDLDDDHTNEIMLIENLQRENIHPLDEAESFLRLIENKMSHKAIALKIGKSLKYVKERLALNNLHPDAKQMFRKDEMQLGHALILCLFTHDQQAEAIKAVIRNERGFYYFDNPMDLKQHMNRNILLNLSSAIFDASNPNLDKKAGACTSCQKQTGTNQQLFACITDKAKCLDKDCFFKKTRLTININNKRLLKQFSKKLTDCPPITDNYYSYEDGVLTNHHWRTVVQSDECPNVTLGTEMDRDDNPKVQMVCLNKKCSVHFPKDETNRPSEVPENESKT